MLTRGRTLLIDTQRLRSSPFSPHKNLPRAQLPTLHAAPPWRAVMKSILHGNQLCYQREVERRQMMHKLKVRGAAAFRLEQEHEGPRS